MIVKILKNLLPGFLLFFSLQGCAQNDPSKTLSVRELKDKIIENDSTMIILDVRTESELTGGLPKIDNAIHISVQELEKRYTELEKYKDKEIAVVCRTQNRSSVAADFLREKGFNAKSVSGGMMEYHKK